MNKEKLNLGHSNLEIKRIGLGCMGMSEFYGSSEDTTSIQTLHHALDIGVNFFDTADMYGSGHNETLLGKAFKGKWDDITLATKFGVVRGENQSMRGYCGKSEYVKKCCDASLQRLGVECIDLYYMHRQDPETSIEETVGAMKELVESGKVRYIGLSEVDVDTLRKANRIHPITALQTEFSLWSREPMAELFDVCDELGITFVAYSPLGRGFLTGKLNLGELDKTDFRLQGPRFQEENFQKNQVFVEILNSIAERNGMTTPQVALAWVLQSHKNLATIPGTRSSHRLDENMSSLTCRLSSDDLAEIISKLPPVTFGARYPERHHVSLEEN